MEKTYDLAIAGGGLAGMAAAVRGGRGEDHSPRAELRLGGILPQCIHDGFGLEEFGRTMTGPESALEWIKRVEEAGIEYHTDTAVFDAAAVSDGRRRRKGVFGNSACGISSEDFFTVLRCGIRILPCSGSRIGM